MCWRSNLISCIWWIHYLIWNLIDVIYLSRHFWAVTAFKLILNQPFTPSLILYSQLFHREVISGRKSMTSTGSNHCLQGAFLSLHTLLAIKSLKAISTRKTLFNLKWLVEINSRLLFTNLLTSLYVD